MPPRISALMDGELSHGEACDVLSVLPKEDKLRAQWDIYHLIGDAIRQDQVHDVDMIDRVMGQLSHEPVLLAPRQPHKLRGGSNRWAMAAGVAGMTLVGSLFWLIQGGHDNGLENDFPAKPGTVVAVNDMQHYLLAHQAFAPRGPVQGGVHYIRTVALQQSGSAR